MQTTIVIIIVTIAAVFLLRRFYNSVRKDAPRGCGGSCGCTCQGRMNKARLFPETEAKSGRVDPPPFDHL